MPPGSFTKQILVIDNDPFVVDYLGHLLADFGEVSKALGGTEGIEKARARTPNLIVVNMAMPGLDGVSVCERLRKDAATQHVPVLCMSEHQGAEEEIAALAAGASNFISKPLVPTLLRMKVGQLLQWQVESSSLRELAMRDELTGLYNRRHFDERSEGEWRRQKRSGGFLTVCMVDIDKFKDFNDTLGHAKGDECLAAVADCLSGLVRRPADIVARYGGEEFVFLLPDLPPARGAAFGASICEAVRAMNYSHAGSPSGRLTVSVGVATAAPGAGGGAKELLGLADEAMYQAKAQGRDRHVMHGGKETTTM